MRDDRARLLRTITSLTTGCVAFPVYMMTLAPSLTFGESGRLAATVHTLGIAPPTGFPLYTLLAWAWQLLPFGTVIYRLNLLSAVFMAAAAAVLVHVLWIVLGRSGGPRAHGTADDSGSHAGPLVDEEMWVRALASGIGALVLAFSTTYWRMALSISAMSLQTLLLSLLLLSLLSTLSAETGNKGRQARRWMLSALVLGLSFSNHGATLLLLPALLFLFFREHGAGRMAFARIGQALPFLMLGVSPYVYLPIRASAQPAMNWGDASHWQGFFSHVTGKPFHAWLFRGWDVMALQLDHFAMTLPSEFGYVLLLPAAAGIVISFRRDRRVAAFLLLLAAVPLLGAVNIAILDIDAYFLPVHLCVSVWAAIGIHAFLRRVPFNRLAYGVIAVLVACGVQVVLSHRGASQRGNHLVQDYADNVFRTMEENAVVFSEDWHSLSPASAYLQLVERVRTDVTVIDVRLLRHPWYLLRLQRSLPGLTRVSGRSIASYADEYRKFDRGEPFDTARIRALGASMTRSILDGVDSARPVYCTYGVDYRKLAGYVAVPQGLVFRLYRQGAAIPTGPVADSAFTIRRFPRDSEYSRSMEDRYFNMFAQRGYFLYHAGRKQEADVYFARAAEFRQFRQSTRWKTLAPML